MRILAFGFTQLVAMRINLALTALDINAPILLYFYFTSSILDCAFALPVYRTDCVSGVSWTGGAAD